MLADETYAAQNTHMNRVVYSQLAAETVGGTAYHLIKNMRMVRMYMEHGTICVSGMLDML